MRTKRLLAGSAILFLFCLIGFSFAGKAQQDVYADSLISSSTDIQNPKFCVDGNHTNYASISRLLTLLSNSSVHTEFPSAGKSGDVVNIIVQTTGSILTANVLNSIAVKLYDANGTLVANDSGPNLLQLQVLSAGTNLYAIRAFTDLTDNITFKQAKLELHSLLGVSLINEFRIYDIFIQHPCDPSIATSVFATGSSATAGILSGYVTDANNAVDADINSFAVLHAPVLQLLNLLPVAYIDLKFAKTGRSGNYVGFIVESPSALNIGVLSQLKIDIYDDNNVLRETKNNFSLLDLRPILGSSTKHLLGFTTQFGNYKISRARLSYGGVVTVLSTLNVYGAFQQNVNTPLVVINVSGPTTFCTGGSVTLTAYDTLGNNYMWNTGATTQSITVTQSGIYYVTVIDTVNCNRRSIEIPVNVLPSLNVKILGDTLLCPGATGILYTSQHYDTYKWSTGSTSDTITINALGVYSVAVTQAPNCKDTGYVAVVDCYNPPPPLGDSINIHNVVTPNNDGLNDFWVIEGLQRYPKNEVMVFSKWGDKVFERRGYASDAVSAWRGKLNDSSSDVPDGTYFYVIKLNGANPGGKTEYTGFIMIQR